MIATLGISLLDKKGDVIVACHPLLNSLYYYYYLSGGT